MTAARRGGCVALGAAALLAACSQQQSVMTSDPNVPPANHRAEILAYLRNYQNDPTGIRDAAIAEPALRPVPGGTQRYVVCLRYNAKSTTGKYEGTRERLVVFLGGRLDTMVPARGEQCANQTWQPFPELEKLRR
jgi:hypothetical protein